MPLKEHRKGTWCYSHCCNTTESKNNLDQQKRDTVYIMHKSGNVSGFKNCFVKLLFDV